MTSFAISMSHIYEAEGNVRPFVLQTPLIEANLVDGLSLSLKCENLQKVSAFKARGACNAVFKLNDAQASAGIVTHSSGNHAAAIALAGKLRSVPVTIVMPHNSSPLKIAAVRSYGIEPAFCEPTAEARQAAADQVVAETGATFIHPFDHPDVMAGQGTVALELLKQCPDLDTVIVPVGGGGLISGMSTAIKALRPSVKIIAAEPEWADDTKRSFETGIRQPAERYDSICDGLRTPVGKLTFPIIQAKVDAVETVSEAQICKATIDVLLSTKMLVEPSAAVAIAVARKRAAELQGQTVACVMTGGNLAADSLVKLLQHQLESEESVQT
ncbi:MAG: threonine/serine dehydratase [Fuerstiella sp.]